MLLISVSLSMTKFPPEQRVEQEGMIQSSARSIEHEHEHEHEYEYEKKHEQCGAPELPAVLSSLFQSWSPATTVTTDIL